MNKARVEPVGGHTFEEVLQGRTEDVQEIAGLARDLILRTLPKLTEVPWPRRGRSATGSARSRCRSISATWRPGRRT